MAVSVQSTLQRWCRQEVGCWLGCAASRLARRGAPRRVSLEVPRSPKSVAASVLPPISDRPGGGGSGGSGGNFHPRSEEKYGVQVPFSGIGGDESAHKSIAAPLVTRDTCFCYSFACRKRGKNSYPFRSARRSAREHRDSRSAVSISSQRALVTESTSQWRRTRESNAAVCSTARASPRTPVSNGRNVSRAMREARTLPEASHSAPHALGKAVQVHPSPVADPPRHCGRVL